MAWKFQKGLSLKVLLDTSIRLIKMGLSEIQKIDGANAFYHPLMMTLASGIERLMKVIICFHTLDSTGEFPSFYPWEKKRKGHDLVFLLDHITENCFSAEYLTNIPVAKKDIEFLKTDQHVSELIRILSAFAQSTRYYNLDLIKGQKHHDSPKAEWLKMELLVLSEKPDWQKFIATDLNLHETYKHINKEIVVRFEKFVRALSRLFTIGGLGQKAKQYSVAVFPFGCLSDDQLGTTNYEGSK